MKKYIDPKLEQFLQKIADEGGDRVIMSTVFEEETEYTIVEKAMAERYITISYNDSWIGCYHIHLNSEGRNILNPPVTAGFVSQAVSKMRLSALFS